MWRPKAEAFVRPGSFAVWRLGRLAAGRSWLRDNSGCPRPFGTLPLFARELPWVMPIDPDDSAGALLETWQHLAAGVPDGWVVARSGAIAAVTGVGISTLNGVWVNSADADSAVVGELLDRVASTGLPHCLQVRPDCTDLVSDLAAARGMTRNDHAIPLMVLEDSRQLGSAQAAEGLVIRELVPAEMGIHAEVAAAGFEAPLEAFVQLLTPALLALPGVRCYVGEVGGQSVTTGLGVTLGSYVGIFNIATPPAHRRRGYGAAVTTRAIADGLAAGATWAWLQSSEAGFAVYERLGFRTAEAWSCWLSAEAT